ncbi:MAG TPA: metal ABC transporter ATP-binding protein [Bacteroidia bacterium]|nr:metal ABC transporter ATP-binding protein [Bacteroidia bacterium]HNT80448.1 metal ABC transporter ATP-binding protein [Bacteroidia bacterium]
MAAIEAHNLTATYTGKPVLWDIDFKIPEGQLIGILGPNGSGKSTLMKSIMNLIEPVSGHIKIFDSSLDQVRQRVAYVPQRESIDWDFPASVYEVVLMGRYKRENLFRPLKSEDKRLALQALEQVQLTSYGKRQISQLSGGQQQRVLLARALAREADLYLMDEPFAGVDATTESALLEIMNQLKKKGKTVVIIHHDIETARNYFDWIVLLNTRLIKSGKTEEVLTQEYLSQAYGGSLSILQKLGDEIEKHQFPVREKGMKEDR